MTIQQTSNPDLQPEPRLMDIAEYVTDAEIKSAEAYSTARLCLIDALGCGVLALQYPECAKHLGPVVPGTVVPHGSRVPGTEYVLDPVLAAFDITCLIRWLDFNDTWLAAEWGHPSDNFGGILAVADSLSRARIAKGLLPLTMHDVLSAGIKAYEIQGILALANSFNRVGLDHVLLVKAATAAVATHLLGGGVREVYNALSQAWIDNGSLRTYRHWPNTGSRKSWAAADATSRGVWLAWMTMKGEMGYASPLSAPRWGFYDVMFRGQPFQVDRPYGSYVIENILFKISSPAEFHAQTALEAAVRLHPLVKDRLEEISEVVITTHESAMRIINKTGPLHNPADRDHCLQYITAIGLIFGGLTAKHYEDNVAADPRIDRLRGKMSVVEDAQFSRDYLDPEKRSIANAVQVKFQDGSQTENILVEYPLGHRRRRKEGIPLLERKLAENLSTHYSKPQVEKLSHLCLDQKTLEGMPVNEFLEYWL